MTIREFLLPDLGEGLTEAVIVSWAVAVGDEVEIDQAIVEVESAKSVVELPVPFAGIVEELCGDPGDTVHKGQPIIRVRVAADAGDADDAVPAQSPNAADAHAASADERAASEHLGRPNPADAESSEYSGAVLTGYGLQESTARLKRPEGGRFRNRSTRGDTSGSSSGVAAAASGSSTGVAAYREPGLRQAQPSEGTALVDETRNSPVMSPLVRREAKAAGFDARHVEGSGPNGLVVRADVERVVEALRTAQGSVAEAALRQAQGSDRAQGSEADALRRDQVAGDAQLPAGDRRIPVEGMRALVAQHMAESHSSVPKATIWLDVDATPLMELRAQLREATDEKFSLTTLIARLVVAGLRQHPRLNSSFDEAAGEIIEHDEINLGIAAQTPRGLTVPVVHGAGRMSLRELRDGIGGIVEESGRGNFPPAKLAGGTFTLNNYGGFGVDGASPIINLPQAAMLGIGRLKERPWVVDGELAVRKVVTVSFVFDHRVCDGDAASAFLTFVTDRMERPALLFADL